jgi:hypothetical protein
MNLVHSKLVAMQKKMSVELPRLYEYLNYVLLDQVGWVINLTVPWSGSSIFLLYRTQLRNVSNPRTLD